MAERCYWCEGERSKEHDKSCLQFMYYSNNGNWQDLLLFLCLGAMVLMVIFKVA